MQLKLSLPENKIVWALNSPYNYGYIKDVPEVGTQDCVLILTQEDNNKIIELDEYPKWAQNMIISSIRSGDIINTGDSIELSSKKDNTTIPVKEKPPKPNSRKKK